MRSFIANGWDVNSQPDTLSAATNYFTTGNSTKLASPAE